MAAGADPASSSATPAATGAKRKAPAKKSTATKATAAKADVKALKGKAVKLEDDSEYASEMEERTLVKKPRKAPAKKAARSKA